MSKFKFSELQKIIRIKKNKAKKEVQKEYPILISRGNEFSSYIGNNSIEDGDRLTFNTKKELIELFDEAISKGATKIFIEGDFDGYESVYDIKEGCCANKISEWHFEFWNNKSGYCFKPENIIINTPKKIIDPSRVFKTETFYTQNMEEFFCVMKEVNRPSESERIFLCEELTTGKEVEFSESTIVDLIDNYK